MNLSLLCFLLLLFFFSKGNFSAIVCNVCLRIPRKLLFLGIQVYNKLYNQQCHKNNKHTIIRFIIQQANDGRWSAAFYSTDLNSVLIYTPEWSEDLCMNSLSLELKAMRGMSSLMTSNSQLERSYPDELSITPQYHIC